MADPCRLLPSPVSLVVRASYDGCAAPHLLTAAFLVVHGALLWSVPTVPVVLGEEDSLDW